MLTQFFFRTTRGLGYGVTAFSLEDAEKLLKEYDYPIPSVQIIEVIYDVKLDQLDQLHVIPNSGPMVVRGVWFPMHNV